MATFFFFFFFFFFFVSGLKLDEKSIENGLEGQKFLVVCLFWGGCHHPNAFSSECEKQLSLIRFEDLENRVAEELKVFACAINKGFQKINKCVIFFFLQAPCFDDLKSREI